MAGAGDPDAAHGRRLWKERAASSLCLAPRRNGRPDACFCIDSRCDDGDRGCVPDRALPPDLRAQPHRSCDRRMGRRLDGSPRCDHRYGAVRHQESHGVFHRLAAWLYVPWAGCAQCNGRCVSCVYACVFQSDAVPFVWRRHAWVCRPARSEKTVRALQTARLAHHGARNARRLSVSGGSAGNQRIFLQRHDSCTGVYHAGARLSRAWMDRRRDCRAYRVLRFSRLFPCLSWADRV